MFSSVSWHDFLITVVILLVLYYSTLLLLFYRKAIWKVLHDGIPKHDKSSVDEPDNKEATPGAGILLEELHHLFEQAAEKQYHREELMQAIRSRLKNYGQLKATPFEAAVNQYIQQSAASFFSISLGDTDLKQLW